MCRTDVWWIIADHLSVNSTKGMEEAIRTHGKDIILKVSKKETHKLVNLFITKHYNIIYPHPKYLTVTYPYHVRSSV